MRDGRVTAEGLEALRARMPYANPNDQGRDRRLDDVTGLFTAACQYRGAEWRSSRRDA